MSWDSFSKSLGSIIEERLFSPLVSGFIISWSILNWKFWAFVFWSKDLDDLLKRVAGLRDNPYDFLLYYFAAPFVFAVGYVYLFPKLSRPVTKRWRENQKLAEDDRKDVEALELLDLPKSQALRAENYRLRAQVDDVGAERDQANEDAKAAHKALRAAEAQRDASANEAAEAIERHNQIKSQLQSLSTALEDRRNELLQAVARSDQLQELLTSTEPSTPEGNLRRMTQPNSVHVAVVKSLIKNDIVHPGFELPMLYALIAMKDGRLLTDSDIYDRIPGHYTEQSIHLALVELANTGYVKPDRKNRVDEEQAYVITDRGQSVVAFAMRFDKLFDYKLP